MREDGILSDYYHWILMKLGMTENDGMLLRFLHKTEYHPANPLDENREYDGFDLRARYAYETDENPVVVRRAMREKGCSMLEMMAALAIRCEESIMHDEELGDRTEFWFCHMLYSMGFGPMLSNSQFSPEQAEDIVTRFLENRYEPNGSGGLFYIPGCREDLRKTEIWYQMMLYLDKEG